MTTYEAVRVPVAGGELAAGDWRADAPGPALLAVHGITANHLAWSLAAETLPGTRVLAPDLRGRGRSSGLPGPYGLVDHADDLARALDARGIDRAVVAGHSMGGFVAVRLAERHPDRVESLVLVDGGLPLEPPPGIPAEEAAKAVLGPALARLSMRFASPEAYVDFWRDHPGVGPYWNDAVEAYVRYDLDGEAPELRSSARPEAIAVNALELDGSAGYAAALAALDVPIEFLRAERGLLDQPEGLYAPGIPEQWALRLPTLRTREVRDVNHYSIIMTAGGLVHVIPVIEAHVAAATAAETSAPPAHVDKEVAS
ncbi:alpha/beta hydrolase [Agromyces agglutinans]|nr:alpha/beta hydrolase [Agromyces agglutinans]